MSEFFEGQPVIMQNIGGSACPVIFGTYDMVGKGYRSLEDNSFYKICRAMTPEEAGIDTYPPGHFQGCDKEIEVALRNGEFPRCEYKTRTFYCVGYCVHRIGRYLSETNAYQSAKLIKQKTYVIGRKEMLAALVAHGYEFNDMCNSFQRKDCESFVSDMWKTCGKEKAGKWGYEPWMLEEK